MSEALKAAFVEPLKLNEQEHAKLVAQASRPDERRSQPRFPAPPTFKVLVRFDAGSAATMAVRLPVSDLSEGGIGLLHSSFIPAGVRCMVSMITVDREAVSVRGSVAHCQYIGGRAHIIGVRFDSPIDPTMFIAVAPEKPRPAGGGTRATPDGAGKVDAGTAGPTATPVAHAEGELPAAGH
jgi:hypothetical protein